MTKYILVEVEEETIEAKVSEENSMGIVGTVFAVLLFLGLVL